MSKDFNASGAGKSKYRPEIDGLRAFAVVAVIINHFNKDVLPSGYLGVDIFFVISGYVITSSLADRKSKNFLDFVTGFYVRRIKRLVPALVVFVLITSVLICLFNPDPGVAIKTGIASLFGFSNLYLYKQSTDYFSQSTEINPFTHTWSLGVEEQFYLLFPFLIWFSGFGQQTAKGARNLFFWVGALTIASLIGFICLHQVNQPAAYFLMPSRFWEMAAGCLIFIGFQKRAKIEQALEQVPPLLVVAAMVGVMFLPVAAAVPSTIGVVVLSAVLIASMKQGTAAYQFFTLEKVVYIGLISYSLYLWHWTVLSISRWTIGIHWWSVPFQIGLMAVAANLSYQKIERRFRNHNLMHDKLGIYVIGVTAIGVSSLFSVALLKKSSYFYTGARSSASIDASPSINRPKGCENAFRLLIIGDSHAGHLSQAKDYACSNYNTDIEVLSEGGTPFPTVIYSNSFHGVSREERVLTAKKLNKQWADTKIPSKREGAVLLSNRSLVYFDHKNSDDNKNSTPVRYSTVAPSRIIADDQFFEEWKNRLSNLLDKYSQTTFIYALPNPEFRELSTTAPLCRREWFRPIPSIYCFEAGKRSDHSRKHYYFRSEIEKISKKHRNLIVFDYFDLICQNSSPNCTVMGAEGLPMYRDADHFTQYGAEKVIDRLSVFLRTKGIDLHGATDG